MKYARTGSPRECGQPSSIERGERLFFERDGLQLPRRYGACRAVRRGQRKPGTDVVVSAGGGDRDGRSVMRLP